jgi:hypothetical protein
MKTLHRKNPNPPRQRSYRFWFARLALVVGIPILFYYGYCWGLWGRSSLLLQYLFHCSCPPASEEARYPENVDIIVPACRHINSILSPTGRLLYVQEAESTSESTYLLNLETNEKIPFALPDSAFYFLTDNLLYVIPHYGKDEYVLDRTVSRKYLIQKFIHLEPNAYSYGEVDPGLLLSSLLRVERIFLIDSPSQLVVALSSDFQNNSENSFVFNGSDLPEEDKYNIPQFLQNNNIAYSYIADNFSDEVISPNGKLIARSDGIYLIETNQKIVEGYYLSVRGWSYDGRGAIYSHAFGRCLMWINFPFADDRECFLRVPQPVLLLKVPQEYLKPTQMP